MEILDGKSYSSEIKQSVKEKVESFCRTHKRPLLACIIVGDDKASEVYVKSKEKACESCSLYRA